MLMIKSHCEVSDFEEEVFAKDAEDAYNQFVKRFKWLKSWDKEGLMNKMFMWNEKERTDAER